METKKNEEYLAKLDQSYTQLKQGKTISFSIQELRDMESDNWKPTKKIIDFMKQ